MAARRTINAINWAGIAERLAEADKPIFATFRSKTEGYLRRMNEFPETVPAIDWAYYKKNIAASGLVDTFQKEYEALKVPYPADKYTSIVEEQEKEAVQLIQKFVSESNQRIATHEAEVKRIDGMIPFNQMTMNDAFELYPEVWSPEKPTIWPHDPEWQPGEEPEPIPKPEH